MTEPDDEYGDLLRRALHAEADTVMPHQDGLTLIRSRIEHRGRERRRRFGTTPFPGGVNGWRTMAGSLLGRVWYGETWLRATAAVAATVIVALAVVSAPPAIQRFTSAGQKHAIEQDDHGAVGDTATSSQYGQPPALSRGPGGGQQPPAARPTPTGGVFTGPSGCGSPAPTVSPAGGATIPPVRPCPQDGTPTVPATPSSGVTTPPPDNGTPDPGPPAPATSDPAVQQPPAG